MGGTFGLAAGVSSMSVLGAFTVCARTGTSRQMADRAGEDGDGLKPRMW